MGVRQTAQPRVPVWGNKASKLLTEKTFGSCGCGRTPSLTGEFTGETQRVLKHTQTHPALNQHQKAPVCLWVAEEVTEIRLRVQQVA